MSVRRDRQTQRRDANIGHIGEALGCCDFRESGASSPGLLVAVVLGHRVNYRPW